MNDTDREQLRARTIDRKQIGVDAKGRRHYFDPVLGVVWVAVDDEIAHVEEVALAEWIEFVSRRVGWSEHRYEERGLAEHIIEILSASE